jgi:CRISPR-associated protein Cmr6
MVVNQPQNSVPKMYLAQIEGRCSLQYTAEDADRQQWIKEWVDPKQDGHPYQHSEQNIKLGKDGSMFRIQVNFPWRVFSNCGQDSILRPVLGKNGIPFIPGSSIKGLFRRVCDETQKILYCGDKEHPGLLRFHGAYPVGNWTAKCSVTRMENGQAVQNTYYLIEDLVHPQQKRQVEREDITSASALISLYKPTLIFEFSSTYKHIEWPEVEQLLQQALCRGIGGKTSTGYGFGSVPDYTQSSNELLYKEAFHIRLEGTGVSSKLLSGNPEFRPNIFKAVLRGHTCRLLAGVCQSEELVRSKVEHLFGSTKAPGQVQIYWEQSQQPRYDKAGRKASNPTYNTQGNLHFLAPPIEQEFINLVLRFAFIMGGFGKSWRRIAHEVFHKTYVKLPRKFDIGCHWKCFDSDWVNVRNVQELTAFLDSLQAGCTEYLQYNSVQPLQRWREAWHRERVLVYSQVVSESQIVELFHDSLFKTTPAIGGRKPGDQRPTFVSSVWHRMLPIPNNQYLEIVTIFHGDRTPWKRQGTDQLSPFIEAITSALEITTPTWGDDSKL